ncbi:MAG: tetraacyldisaccharide 4'-kinase [Vicinamibacterales bacterium]|nr:tetraacyldisaccharide 4'-kinase [Vicinamibacterales bacterium]
MRRLLGHLYGAAAWRRRRWYVGHPETRRRLRQPVISIGALRVGGSGKTPLTAHLARVLLGMGERPAVLSRGYGRANAADGVVVVREAGRVVGRLTTAGDEPWMLAQSLDGVVVVVCPDRYLAGRLAETHLGATVHLLDDGFQHLPLQRGTDLLVVSPSDLEAAVLPAGPLRERLSTARCADAMVVIEANDEHRQTMAEHLALPRCFGARRCLGAALVRAPWVKPGEIAPGTPVFAVAGIARPERFFEDVRDAGFALRGTRAFRDHYRYGPRDAARVIDAAQAAGAEVIVTTEKDGVRLESMLPLALPVATMALALEVEPARAFQAFLAERLAAERRVA